MADFSKGGVHETDGLWWVIFQRGEYMKPMGSYKWFFKGGTTQNQTFRNYKIGVDGVWRKNSYKKWQFSHATEFFPLFPPVCWSRCGTASGPTAAKAWPPSSRPSASSFRWWTPSTPATTPARWWSFWSASFPRPTRKWRRLCWRWWSSAAARRASSRSTSRTRFCRTFFAPSGITVWRWTSATTSSWWRPPWRSPTKWAPPPSWRRLWTIWRTRTSSTGKWSWKRWRRYWRRWARRISTRAWRSSWLTGFCMPSKSRPPRTLSCSVGSAWWSIRWANAVSPTYPRFAAPFCGGWITKRPKCVNKRRIWFPRYAFFSAEEFKRRSIDWLFDWLIDWPTVRSLDCLIDWLVHWLIGRLIDWLIGPLIDWLIAWLIDWSIDWLVDWLIDWLAHWSIDWLIGFFSWSCS